MSRDTATPERVPETRAGDAIAAAQRRARSAYFVGRETEVDELAGLLASGAAPRIVFVHGPGGIGKSSLLDAFRDAAERMGADYAYLDARRLPIQPDALKTTVNAACGAARVQSGATCPVVVALDHAENLSALDGWLRAELIPALPGRCVLVIAGRQRPGPEWRADNGLKELLIDCELGPLAPAAVDDYLARRSVPEAQRPAVAAFARGHPLALSLAADRVLREPAKPFEAAGCPDLIHDLVGWLLRDVSDEHRLRALEACATVRLLDEPLLAAMLNRDDVRAEFDWLATQHFVEQQPPGLVIHDLLREVVVSDLRGRNLERHHDLIRRASAHLLSGLDNAGRPAALQAVGDTIYTLRHEPHAQRQFPFGDVHCYPDAARPEELSGLIAEVDRLEGGESAAWLRWWLDQGAGELMVMRDHNRNPVALALALRFSAEDVAAGCDDPAVAALFRHLHRHAPLRGNEQAMLIRFLLAYDTHQARTPVWAQLAAQLNGLAFTPGVAVLCFVADLAYDWGGITETADARLLPDGEYRIGGRRYTVMGHDTRREPPLDWARNCVERILRDGDAPELLPADIVLLERRDFEEAVSRALHDFHDDRALADNPLLQAPVLRFCARRHDTEALRRLLRETAAARLPDSAEGRGLHDVLERLRFSGDSAKQHAVAVDLNMSERTLRRRLRRAEARLADALWVLETGAA